MISAARTQHFAETYLKGAQVYTIRVPKGFGWDPEWSLVFMQHLLSQFGRITFCIVSEPDQIRWQVLDLWHRSPPGLFAQAVTAIYPEAQVEVASYLPPVFKQPFYRGLILYRQAGDFSAPMKYVEELKRLDPLVSLVQAIRDLRPGERVTHMLHVMGHVSETMLQAAHQRITVSQIHPLQLLSSEGIGRTLGLMLSGNSRAPRYQERDQRILEDRLRKGFLYNSFLMTQVDVQNIAELPRISNLVSAVLQFGSDFNALLPSESMERMVAHVDSLEKERTTSALGRMGAWFAGTDPGFPQVWAILSAEELAALWHLPHAGFTAPEVSYLPGGQVPLPAILARNTEGVCLGTNQVGGRQTLVRMRTEDRATHINVIGKTGVGKSTLMHAMIHQDIQDGQGVGVVDPHGKLVIDILRYSIPDRRMEDVVVLDIANETYPPPLNPMIVPGERPPLAAGQVVAVLDKIYDVKAQRVEDSLTAALVTLMQEPTSTVRDVVKLFADIAYRHDLIEKVGDPVTHEFWEEFEHLSPSVQKELSYPVLHRMRHFYRNPSLYPILCHPDALNFADLIAQRKIILLSLGIDERKVPAPEQQLLGAVLVSQLQMAVMQNLIQIVPFFLYVDEAQNFVTSSLEKLLAEARKYGLHLTLANQFLGQLKGSLLESVIGTVGATVVFQCGLNDAKLLAPYFGPGFSVEELINLPLYQAAVKMRHAGQTLPAFTLQTLPPPYGPDLARAQAREEQIRQRSATRYTPKTRTQVLSWLEGRYPLPHAITPKEEEENMDSFDWIVPER